MSEYLNDPMFGLAIFMGFFVVFYGALALAINFTKWFG